MWSKRLLIFIFIFNFAVSDVMRDWQGQPNPFHEDVEEYYSYNLAFFIHKDPGFSHTQKRHPPASPLGYHVPKMSMGMALAYTPAFLIAHGITIITGGNANGLSGYYSYILYFYSILIAFAGLIFLRNFLLEYFTDQQVFYTLICIFFGTNLLYYTIGSNLMTHGYIFTMISMILFYTQQWYNRQKIKYILAIGFLSGWLVLIRPTSILVLFVPLLFGVTHFSEFKLRIQFVISQYKQILFAFFAFILPWLPQMIYWKIYTGSFVYYSYGKEGFDFFHPQITNVLFSWRKGWLLYTPVMALALVGFIRLFKQLPQLFWASFLYFIFTFYVLASWWCWAWGGSFSNRALIDTYPLLAIPLAVLIQGLIKTNIWKFVRWFVLCIVLFNLLQTYQYTATIIRWDGMTKEAYQLGLFKLKLTEEEKVKFNAVIKTYHEDPETWREDRRKEREN